VVIKYLFYKEMIKFFSFSILTHRFFTLAEPANQQLLSVEPVEAYNRIKSQETPKFQTYYSRISVFYVLYAHLEQVALPVRQQYNSVQ